MEIAPACSSGHWRPQTTRLIEPDRAIRDTSNFLIGRTLLVIDKTDTLFRIKHAFPSDAYYKCISVDIHDQIVGLGPLLLSAEMLTKNQRPRNQGAARNSTRSSAHRGPRPASLTRVAKKGRLATDPSSDSFASIVRVYCCGGTPSPIFVGSGCPTALIALSRKSSPFTRITWPLPSLAPAGPAYERTFTS